MSPGKQNESQFNNSDFRLYDQIINFIYKPFGTIADISPVNQKMEYIKAKLGIEVTQLDCEDYNFPDFKGKFNVVCCFEVLEHLQNQLLFMIALKRLLKDKNSKLYLSMPGRIPFMWSKHHYFEIPPTHLDGWLLNNIGLRILRKKRLRLKSPPFKDNLVGIRPDSLSDRHTFCTLH